MAQSLAGYLDLRHITGLSGSDLEMNSSIAKGFAPGQPIWMYDAAGLRMFTLVQNKATAHTAFTRGQVVSRMGGAHAVFIASASTGTTTSFPHASSTIAENNSYVGAIAQIMSTQSSGVSAAATNESEWSIIVSCTTAAVNVDSRAPYSVAPAVGQSVQIISTYNCEPAAAADTNSTVAGVIVAQNGIGTGNFGFAQSIGFCPRILKDTTSTQGFIVGTPLAVTTTGQVGCSGTASASNTVIGRLAVTAITGAYQTEVSGHLLCGQQISGYLQSSVTV